MVKTRTVLTVNLVVFSLIFLLHLTRIFTGFNAQFGNWIVPLWISVVAAIVSLIFI